MKKSLLLAAALVAGAATMQAETTRIYVGFAPDPLPENAEAILPGTEGDVNAWQLYLWMGWDNRAIVASASSGFDSAADLSYTEIVQANQYGYFGATLGPAEGSTMKFNLKGVKEDWVYKYVFRTDIPTGCYVAVGREAGPANKPYQIDITPANYPDFDFTGKKWNTLEVPVTDFMDYINMGDDATNLAVFTSNWAGNWMVIGSIGDGVPDGKFIQVAYSVFESPNADDQGAIDDVAVDAETVAVEYVDIQGRVLSAEPENGLFIKKEIKADGTVKTTKIVK